MKKIGRMKCPKCSQEMIKLDIEGRPELCLYRCTDCLGTWEIKQEKDLKTKGGEKHGR